MQKLTGLDEMFLSVDAAGTTNGVMGGLVIYKRPRSPHAAREEAMVERIQTRFGQVPFMGWKLARTPLGLDHHRWVDAGPVDVADHVRTIQLPGKGTDRVLAAEVAALMEVPLPKDRPLWELVINQRDESVNRDIDLQSLSDIRVLVFYNDFTSF